MEWLRQEPTNRTRYAESLRGAGLPCTGATRTCFLWLGCLEPGLADLRKPAPPGARFSLVARRPARPAPVYFAPVSLGPTNPNPSRPTPVTPPQLSDMAGSPDTFRRTTNREHLSAPSLASTTPCAKKGLADAWLTATAFLSIFAESQTWNTWLKPRAIRFYSRGGRLRIYAW